MTPTLDPKRDLFIERYADVPRSLVWAAWTQPQHLSQWFTPKPWTIPECEIDLRPGGTFRVLMRSPEGEVHPNIGCYLEVVPQERLVWTDALGAGYRPTEKPFITAFVNFSDEGSGTRYQATVLHRDEAERKRHEEMGFFDGWGTVFAQVAEYAKTITP